MRMLPALVDPHKAMAEDAPVLREDIADKMEGAHGPRKHKNHIFTWEVGDKSGAEQALADSDVIAEEKITYQRVHPCPLETCGCVASMDKVNGKLTVWGTFQAPHAVRTVASLISTIPEHNIRIVSPDIGGGFGNKVGVYPGYICSIVASIVTGVPVKWVEDRIENLSSTAFARDYHMTGKIAATKDGKITGLWCHVLADHGAFDACADPTKFPPVFLIFVRARTIFRWPMSGSMASTPTKHQAASPIAARSASPKLPTLSNAWWMFSPESWAWTRPSSA